MPPTPGRVVWRLVCVRDEKEHTWPSANGNEGRPWASVTHRSLAISFRWDLPVDLEPAAGLPSLGKVTTMLVSL